ncbi:MAG: alpha-amylase family glycosyl hydrolase [Bacteroidia bacterium]
MHRIFKSLFAFGLGIFLSQSLFSQVVSVDPIFPTVEDTVTITFAADEGNGELVGVSPVFGHMGLITSTSTSPSDWKYVQGNWGTADPNTLMTDIGNEEHEIRVHIRSFYGVPQGETVNELSFVFRNADGSKVGRSADGSDIYYPVYQAGALNVAFLTPNEYSILEQNDQLPVEIASSDSAGLTLLLNGTQIAQGNGKSLSYNLTAGAPGNYSLKLIADNGTTTKEDSIGFTVRGPINVQDPAVGIEAGINYLSDTSVVLALYAPGKSFVYAVGDFSNWLTSADYFMNQSVDGNLWWVQINGLTPAEEYAYQYHVDGTLEVADPYCDKVLDPWNDSFIPPSVYPNLKAYPVGANDIVSVFQTAQTPYLWQTNNYTRPDQSELYIYELLIRDFVSAHDYKTVLDSLDYLQKLGVNAIELMPIMEFEGNSSWGYNPSYLFAVDKYYGTKNDFKAFVDSCHARGIAVIMDMVVNHHFGQSPLARLYFDGATGKPAADNPWFNQDATHPFNVGYDMNHESPATKEYVDRILRYWVEEYKVDGYRMDLSKGFTQTNYGGDVGAWSSYDAGRVAILKRMADSLWSVDPASYFILEHFAANNEEKELAEYGMMVWGNMTHNYAEASMGYISGSNFSGISHQNRGWNAPHLIGYMESHDEERMMYKNIQFGNASGNYNTKNLETALARIELSAAFFIPLPGPKMIWQFGEYGYDFSIDFNGRVGEKPIRWDYLQNPYKFKLNKVFQALGELRNSHPVFHTSDFSVIAGGAFKRIHLNDPTMNVTIIGNFEVVDVAGNPNFQHTGMWYDYFSGDSIDVTNATADISLVAGEYHIYTDLRLTQPDVALSNEDVLSHPLSLEAYPNPFSEQVVVSFALAKSENVTVDIINSMGQVVAVLALGERFGPEPNQLFWNGKNSAGMPLSEGIYFVRIQTQSGVVDTQRILLQK